MLNIVIEAPPQQIHAMHLVDCLGQHGVADHAYVRPVDVRVSCRVNVRCFASSLGIMMKPLSRQGIISV